MMLASLLVTWCPACGTKARGVSTLRVLSRCADKPHGRWGVEIESAIGFRTMSADHLCLPRPHWRQCHCTGVGAAALSHSNHRGRVLFSGLLRCHGIALPECGCPLVDQAQRSRLLKRRATASVKDGDGRLIS